MLRQMQYIVRSNTIKKAAINLSNRCFCNYASLTGHLDITVCSFPSQLPRPCQTYPIKHIRYFHSSPPSFNEASDENEGKERQENETEVIEEISVETSQRYLKSEAYGITYGKDPVWVKYRRNFRGQFAPKTTRPTCINNGKIITGNPCPLCRDKYLVVDYRNVDLLNQFVSPQSDAVLPYKVTNICQKKQLDVEVQIEKARIHGLMTFHIPFREYDYDEFVKKN